MATRPQQTSMPLRIDPLKQRRSLPAEQLHPGDAIEHDGMVGVVEHVRIAIVDGETLVTIRATDHAGKTGTIRLSGATPIKLCRSS